MNTLRELVLAVGIVAAAVMLAVPPWAAHGYAPLWAPPGPQAHIDVGLLTRQYLIGGLLVAVVFSLTEPRAPRRTSAWLSEW